MDLLLLLARLLLAAVFTVAGVAKVADLAGSRQAMEGFGVHRSLAAPLGVLLPFAEIAVAFLLLPASLAWWGAVGALILLAFFLLGIAWSLAKGRAPDCHCFGQLHSEPVGWSTFARNTLLAGVAALLVWRGPNQVGGTLGANVTPGTISTLALIVALVAFILVLVEAYFILHLMRQNGRLLLRLDALEGRTPEVASAEEKTETGLPIGAPAPTFSLNGLYGETLTLGALRAAEKPMLLLFSDPQCGPCNALLPEIGHWQRDYDSTLRVVPISRGPADANRNKAAEHGLQNVLLQNDFEVAQAYGVKGTPSAVLVNPGGTIASSLAGGADAIRALVHQTVASPSALPMLPVVSTPAARDCACGQNGNGATNGSAQPPLQGARRGDLAPHLRLPDLNGQQRDLADFKGKPTLLLFWNPGCGYCQRMLTDLKAWEENRPHNAPQVVLVSTGTREANVALGLRSPILLDQSSTAARPFSVVGTPSALLLDANGHIASHVAAGADAVMALARGESVPIS